VAKPLIEASIATLGFSIKDVKVLLNAYAHFDHAGVGRFPRAREATRCALAQLPSPDETIVRIDDLSDPHESIRGEYASRRTGFRQRMSANDFHALVLAGEFDQRGRGFLRVAAPLVGGVDAICNLDGSACVRRALEGTAAHDMTGRALYHREAMGPWARRRGAHACNIIRLTDFTMRRSRTAALLGILLLVASSFVRAQSPAIEPELVLGLALQPDAVKDSAGGGYNFILLPVGPTAGVALRWMLGGGGGSSLGVRVEGAFFQLEERDITTIGTPLDQPESLGLLSATIEWRSPDRSSLPISIGAGATRALSTPRSGRMTTPILSIGILRHLTTHSDLRMAFNAAMRPIGRSWFQLPFAVSIHPTPVRP